MELRMQRSSQQSPTKNKPRTFEQYAALFTGIKGILKSQPLCMRWVSEHDDLVVRLGCLLTGRHLLTPLESSSGQLDC